MIIKKNNIIILDNVKMADTFLSKLIGLLFRKSIPENFGLLFTKSSQMHTIFMLCPIDIIFLDKNKSIIKIYHSIKPFRITKFFRKSYKGFVLELKAGSSQKYFLNEGDNLNF